MKKQLKIAIPILILVLVLVFVLIFPKIIKQDYAANIGEEETIETIKENIPKNDEKEQEAMMENNSQNEEKADKPQETVETMKVVKNILVVNKTYGLPSNYNPGENPTAVSHLNAMIKGAREEIGKKIMSVSGFRSYDYQKGLYARYVKKDGEKKAAMYSAKAGHSEHQTGLAFDIGGVDKKHWVTSSFENTEEAKWLKDNAHRYGFILRYPKGKTDITGYKFEPWHFRYIGVEDATKIYENNLTLEEYLF